MVRVDVLESRFQHLCMSEKATAQVNLRRHPEYWFHDGDIILIAGGQVAYRVHSGVLSRKSKVFSDLLTVSHPTEDELLDGCPTIHLSDKPDDLDIFLGMLYDGWTYRRNAHNATWKVVQSMILLGDKYDVPELRDDGIRQLELLFPSDISLWDAARSRAADTATGASAPSSWENGVAYDPQEIIAMAAVTRMLDLTHLHARTLYQCIFLDITVLAAAIAVPTQAPAFSPADFRVCLQLRDTLPSVWLAFSHQIFETLPDTYCRSLTGCAQVFRVVREDFMATVAQRAKVQDLHAADPLSYSAWRDVLSRSAKQGMCSNCADQWHKHVMRLRQDFLDSLENIIGYGS